MQNEEKNKKTGSPFSFFGSLRGLCFAAILAAMSIILGKFLQIPNPFQDFIRLSFENLPIILGGIALGPVAGAMIGVVADLIGCVAYGYTVNPIITLGAASIGAIAGILSNYIVKKPLSLKVILSAVPAHLIGSVLIKSFGLASWYLAKYELGMMEFILWRLLNYALVATAECVILYILLKNRAFSRQMEGLLKK